jgi:SAM-dependent methyltransferase
MVQRIGYATVRLLVSRGEILRVQACADPPPGSNFKAFEDTTSVAKLIPLATGRVLELGPALGNQLERFDKSKVTYIYGVESNPNFEQAMRNKVVECGLEGKYEVIIASIEDSDVLEKHGITEGSLDSIVSIQVLCSVKNPEAVMKEMYRLLKPGGRFIFWEHHANSNRWDRLGQSKYLVAQSLR